MNSLYSLLGGKKETTVEAPLRAPNTMDDAERKKMYSNFQDYLDIKKEAKKKELHWSMAGFFLFAEVVLGVFLFFMLESSWEVRLICVSLPAPLLCIAGMVLKKQHLWWPQLALNVLSAAISNLALVIIIFLVICKPSYYWQDRSGYDYRPSICAISLFLCVATHYMEHVTRKAYAQVPDRKTANTALLADSSLA